MDIFGTQWSHHWQRISQHWREVVAADDIVLIPGDISWAMTLDEAMADLLAIGDMPGRKVMIRGNHDYWWSGITKVRLALPEGLMAVQNDAIMLDGTVICGTRGWTMPGDKTDDNDEKIYVREIGRMRMSLEAARKRSPEGRIIAMIHYPPVDEHGAPSPMSELFEEFGIGDVVYGHLHGAALKSAFIGTARGVAYHQVSCDRLNFMLYTFT